MVYLAKSDTGSGNVWFKIFEDGYTGGRWGVDRMLDNKGRVDVTIPSDLAPGNYLLRGEVIALHSAYDVNGVQPYVGCVELTISGSGVAAPSGVALPGYYTNTDPGMLINIYNTVTSYVIPGPAVYTSGSSSSSSSGSSSTVAPTTTPGSSATTRPTSAPATSAPTTAPTSAPVDGSTLKVQANNGNNVWWFAIAVSGGNEETVKVELADSGSVKNYYIMSTASYGYYFSQSVQLVLPISIRLTSASGKQVELKSYYTSFSDSAVKDTGKLYATSSSTSAPVTAAPTTKPTSAPATVKPTSAPATAAPTTKPTSAATAKPTSAPATAAPTNGPKNPTTAPSGASKVTFKQNAGSSAWWFAVAVSGVDADKISGVELKDSDSVSAFACLEATNWGYYTFATAGTPLVAPVTLRITKTDGTQATATFSSFSGNSEASGSF